VIPDDLLSLYFLAVTQTAFAFPVFGPKLCEFLALPVCCAISSL
jgi:hypothetical protein